MADTPNNASYYYPQCAIKLKIRLEDFGDRNANLASQPFEITALARRVNVEINDYTTADTFNCELDYDSFPFDPRSIRACGVVISIEDMQGLYNEDGSAKKIEIKSENIVFVGFADEESISFDDNSRTVKLEGRDFTSLLIDRKYLEGNINLSQPLDVVIKRMLSKLEETKTLRVVTRGNFSYPRLSQFYSDKTELAGKKNVKKDQTYWELIQSMVADAGLIAYIELDALVITKPRVLFDKSQAVRFVYGQNLKELSFSRKLGRKKGFNLIVRSLNIESKQVLEARIPKEATDEWSKIAGISNQEVNVPRAIPIISKDKSEKAAVPAQPEQETPAEYIAFRVTNVNSKKQLIEIGESIYEEMSRQELEGSFSTKEMAIQYLDVAGRATLFNVLKLRVGTPIAIEISNDDKNSIDKIRDEAGIENYLLKKQYDKRVAKSLSQSLSRNGTPFYTKSVSFEMSSNTGFSCKVEFINFIEIKR